MTPARARRHSRRRPRSPAAQARRARSSVRTLPALTEVRNEIAQFLETEGGIATARELAEYLLAARGAEAADPSLRIRRAAAVVRAALETECMMDKPRWEESRTHGLY